MAARKTPNIEPKKKTEPNGKKTGRPRVVINKAEFEDLCRKFNSQRDIAAHFRCHPDTVRHWCQKTYGASFDEVISEFKADGRISIHQALFDQMETNAKVAIYMAKVHCKWYDDPSKCGSDNSTEEKVDNYYNTLKDVVTSSGDDDDYGD